MISTELGYLSGVTSNIQDQLNGKVGYSTATPNIRNAMYSNIATGWLMRDDMFDSDGNYIQIGFDKTGGVYAYLNSEQVWNIPINKSVICGGGTDMGTNSVVIGWDYLGRGLRLQVDNTALEYIPYGSIQYLDFGESLPSRGWVDGSVFFLKST